ncbi:MAG TPA: YciI family protein, partial [Bacteroidales bacterium]|nr:YciI family protein [Bacteroidales bacterium]
MKRIVSFVCLMIFCLHGNGQGVMERYDSTLAKSLGADDYGMKAYIFVLLKPGSNNLEKGALRDSIFREHLKNIGRLVESGKLVIAGPLGDNEKSYRGIFILNVKTTDEAKELLKTDPAISSKVLDAELYDWYGAASIG